MQSNSRDNVLILGGTGAMGAYLTPLLVDEGFAVDVTSRKSRKNDMPNVTYIQGDAKDFAFVTQVASQKHYAAIFDFMLYDYAEFEARYQSMLDLTDQYFFISSYRVYADADVMVTEETARKVDVAGEIPRFAKDSYGMSKGRQENLLFASGQDNWTIIRPSMTFSHDRFQFGAADNFDVTRSQRGLKSGLPTSIIDQNTSLVYGKDVAKMLGRLVGNGAARGQAFNVVTGENHTWREIGEVFGRVFGLQVVEVESKLYDDAYRQQNTMIDRALNRSFDPSKILTATGLDTRDFYKLEAGLREAWAASAQSKFKNSERAIEAHVRVDELTQSTVDYALLPEKIRKRYHEASLELRGPGYSFKAPDSPVPQKPAPTKASSTKKKSLVSKGLASLRKDGVSVTMRKVKRWNQKRKAR